MEQQWIQPSTESIALCQDEFKLAYHENTTLIDAANFCIENTPPDSILLLEDGHCMRDHAISIRTVIRTVIRFVIGLWIVINFQRFEFDHVNAPENKITSQCMQS